MINTATVIGGLVGRLLGGYLADRYGRRIGAGFNLLLYTLGGLISAVAMNYEMLLASRFIVGIGLGGEFTVGIAMLSEMVATRHRGTLVATLNIGSGGVGNFLSYGLFFLLLGPLRRHSAATTWCGGGRSCCWPCPPCWSSSSAAGCPSRRGSCCPRAGSTRPTGR